MRKKSKVQDLEVVSLDLSIGKQCSSMRDKSIFVTLCRLTLSVY